MGCLLSRFVHFFWPLNGVCWPRLGTVGSVVRNQKNLSPYLGLDGPNFNSEGTLSPCQPPLLVVSTSQNDPNAPLDTSEGPKPDPALAALGPCVTQVPGTPANPNRTSLLMLIGVRQASIAFPNTFFYIFSTPKIGVSGW